MEVHFTQKHARLAINTAISEEALATDISVWGQPFLASLTEVERRYDYNGAMFFSIITLKSVLWLIRG